MTPSQGTFAFAALFGDAELHQCRHEKIQIYQLPRRVKFDHRKDRGKSIKIFKG